jgi:hypothetical protein
LLPIISNLAPSKYIPIEELGQFAVEAAKGHWADDAMVSNSRMRELLKGGRELKI